MRRPPPHPHRSHIAVSDEGNNVAFCRGRIASTLWQLHNNYLLETIPSAAPASEPAAQLLSAARSCRHRMSALIRGSSCHVRRKRGRLCQGSLSAIDRMESVPTHSSCRATNCELSEYGEYCSVLATRDLVNRYSTVLDFFEYRRRCPVLEIRVPCPGRGTRRFSADQRVPWSTTGTRCLS